MTLLELVQAILARVRRPPQSPPPTSPPTKPPVIPIPPLTTGPAPVGPVQVATSWGITTQPSSTATSASPLAQQPVLQVLDQFGAPMALAGVSCVAAINTGTSTLSGTTTVTTNGSGVATFTNLTLTSASTDTLKFTGGGLTQAVSNSIVVTSGTATKLSITTQPSSTSTSGNPFVVQPVIQLRDASNNPISQSGVSVDAAIASGTGTLGGTTTQTTDVSGVATYTNLAITGASTDTIAFSSTGLTGVTSNSIVVSGSGYATPDLMFSDWHGTTIQNSGLLANGNQWDTDTPGHTLAPITNPFSRPWNAAYANRVVPVNFDAGTDSNAGILVLPDLAHTPFKLGYGSTHYIAGYIYTGNGATIGAGTLRKWVYERWNSGHGNSGDPDHVCRGFGPQIGGETDPNVGVTQYPWNSNTANSLVTANAWHWIQIKTVCDTAPGSANGLVTMWYDDPNTPILANVSIHMTSGSSPSGSAWFLDWVRVGAQLESGATAETRYLGPWAMSTQPIGPLL